MTDIQRPSSVPGLELPPQAASTPTNEPSSQGPLQLKGDGPFFVVVRAEGATVFFSSLDNTGEHTSIDWLRPAGDGANNWWIAFHFSSEGRPIEKLISNSPGLEMYPVLRFPILPPVFPLQLSECSCKPGNYDFSVCFSNGEKIDPVIVVSIPPTDPGLM